MAGCPVRNVVKLADLLVGDFGLLGHLDEILFGEDPVATDAEGFLGELELVGLLTGQAGGVLHPAHEIGGDLAPGALVFLAITMEKNSLPDVSARTGAGAVIYAKPQTKLVL